MSEKSTALKITGLIVIIILILPAIFKCSYSPEDIRWRVKIGLADSQDMSNKEIEEGMIPVYVNSKNNN